MPQYKKKNKKKIGKGKESLNCLNKGNLAFAVCTPYAKNSLILIYTALSPKNRNGLNFPSLHLLTPKVKRKTKHCLHPNHIFGFFSFFFILKSKSKMNIFFFRQRSMDERKILKPMNIFTSHTHPPTYHNKPQQHA